MVPVKQLVNQVLNITITSWKLVRNNRKWDIFLRSLKSTPQSSGSLTRKWCKNAAFFFVWFCWLKWPLTPGPNLLLGGSLRNIVQKRVARITGSVPFLDEWEMTSLKNAETSRKMNLWLGECWWMLWLGDCASFHKNDYWVGHIYLLSNQRRSCEVLEAD